MLLSRECQDELGLWHSNVLFQTHGIFPRQALEVHLTSLFRPLL
jgi:hypothetical protein